VYAQREPGPAPGAAPGTGLIARYARGRDYHRAMKKRLHAVADELRIRYPGEEFRSFVDTAPIVERELATRCGIGWVAKHTLVISESLGSYVLLGGFVTTMDLAPPAGQTAAADRCGTCTRCIDACPTDAIEPYTVDASRCVSYLTIELRGAYPPELAAGTGDWLVGCDVCQEVCPHNQPTAARGPAEVDPRYASRRDGFDLLEVLGWDESDRRRAFQTSALKRVSLEMMKRNAIVVAANQLRDHDLPELRLAIERIANNDGEPALVRSTAREALTRLGG